MGLHVTHLSNHKSGKNGDHWLYLLDIKVLNKKLSRNKIRAESEQLSKWIKSSLNNSTVHAIDRYDIHNIYFSNTMINGVSVKELLPAILITTIKPEYFEAANGGSGKSPNAKPKFPSNTRMDPLRFQLVRLPKNATDTDKLDAITKITEDIDEGKGLLDFRVVRQMKKGINRAFVNGVIVEKKKPAPIIWNRSRDQLFAFFKVLQKEEFVREGWDKFILNHFKVTGFELPQHEEVEKIVWYRDKTSIAVVFDFLNDAGWISLAPHWKHQIVGHFEFEGGIGITENDLETMASRAKNIEASIKGEDAKSYKFQLSLRKDTLPSIERMSKGGLVTP